jgi:hypothetical protein
LYDDAAMSRPRFQVSIAILLPLSFLWLMMACVASCERQTESYTAVAARSYENSETELNAQESCCPFESLPEATVPEHGAAKMKFPASSFPIASSDVVMQGAPGRHRSSNPQLPEACIKQLSVLRI